MNFLGLALVANLASIFCALAALLLAYHGREGWGWFLFVAMVCHAGVEFKSRK